MFDVSKAFDNSSETVSDFFQRPGVGFYIPLYQRDYSWTKENIDQLMEDICRGVDSLIEQDNNAIRFLGTIILLLEKDARTNIKPQDHRALPEKIFNVIDGQQRISTISLLGCLLYQKLYILEKRLPSDNIYDGLKEAINRYKSTLLEIFSVDLKRGLPQQKPIIIRGSIDGWTFDGNDDHYQSDVSSFLASFIRKISEEQSEFPKIPENSLVGKNIKQMNSWLNKVEKSHQQETENEYFPTAWCILEKIPQQYLWSYERPELVSIVENRQEKISRIEGRVCSIIQLLAFSYYLLQRCCFTLIEPKSEDWAFDMFQSLNATGTPLTAIETFKPLVVNFVKSTNGEFKGSISEKHFGKIDQLFSSLDSASSKNNLTNNYLTLFGLTYDGGKDPSRQFSFQRQWLTKKYNECSSINDKEEFIHRMANLATYWEKVIKFKPNEYPVIPRTEQLNDKDKKQAAICVLYLQNAGHTMANTILSRFYSLCLREEINANVNFVSVCKAVAAFFTLWRSALPNTGLDEIYRKLLREKMSWQKGDSELSVEVLKAYFKNVLIEKEIGINTDWKRKATRYLGYNKVQAISKFVLFITSHDTIPDPDRIGLMKIGTSGSYPIYLDPATWISPDFKTIEHVAPQKPNLQADATWDEALYENDDYEQIGNLTLLPTKINSSAGNKSWIEKWIYYRHLAESNPGKLAELRQEAEKYGVILDNSTIKLLTEASHAHHIKPIVEIEATGKWDKAFVEKRTERICDILWERMYEWLS
ncbi:DUF262 domain-containing protein [Pelatocladus sp. BLCC-F211]|uniref:DUF262 domain-containing protein n=1 Tax=Pelatocladus sp. BLCC-F211 TaxID=3342752 RepID=UPI0035BAAD6B